MKLGSVHKLDKRSTTTPKIFDDDVMLVKTLLSFFQFIANLEQSGSQIPDT